MHMHAGTRLPRRDLRRECQHYLVFVCQLTHYPFGHNQLVCSFFDVDGEEFDLILLIDAAALGKVAHLGMTVLDLASGLGYQAHGLGPEIGELVERSALVIAFLVGDLVQALRISYDVVLQLTHRLHFHPGNLLERLVRFLQDEFRRTLKGLALTVEIRTEQIDSQRLGKRIDEGSAVLRENIKVAFPRFDEGEKA